MKIRLFIKHCLDITLVILLAGCQLSASTPTLVIETDIHPTQGVNSPKPSPILSISPTVTPLPEINSTATALPIVLPTLTPVPLAAGWIAFLAPDEFGNPFYLTVIKSDGSGLRTIYLDNSIPDQYTSSCWPQPEFSPDGRYLAVNRSSGANVPPELVVIDTTTWHVSSVAVGFGYSFSWSPDSKQLLHTHPLVQNPTDLSFEPDQGLWVLEINSGKEHRLIPTIPDFVVSEVNWSPDGQRIAMHQAFYEGYGRFGIINSDGSGFKKWDGTAIGSFDWSPDGQKIVYDEIIYSPVPSSKLWLMDLQGNPPVPLFDQDNLAASNPQYSPDGQWIEFREVHDPKGEGLAYLWLMRSNGQDPRAFYESALDHVTWVTWASDSFHLLVNNDTSIFLVSVDESPPILLAEGGCPVWQP